MAAFVQRGQPVERGQAGADQQHGIVVAHRDQAVRGPGMALVQRARIERGIVDRRIGRAGIAHRQHRALGEDRAALGEPQADFAVTGGDAEHFVVDQFQPHVVARGGGRFGEHRAQIDAVQPARQERRRVDQGFVTTMLGQPLQEVRGLIRECAHAFGTHVQQMAVRLFAIGHAQAGSVGAFDQDHPQRAGRFPEQVDGDHRAAESGSDDGNGRTARRMVRGRHKGPFSRWRSMRGGLLYRYDLIINCVRSTHTIELYRPLLQVPNRW